MQSRVQVFNVIVNFSLTSMPKNNHITYLKHFMFRFFLRKNLTSEEIGALIAAYRPSLNSTDLVTDTKVAIGDMLGDLWFVCPSQEAAHVRIITPIFVPAHLVQLGKATNNGFCGHLIDDALPGWAGSMPTNCLKG